MPEKPRTAELDELKTLHAELNTLRESYARMRFIADRAQVGISNCSRDRHFKYVNHHYAEQLGLTPEDIVGQRVVDVLGQQAYDAFKPYIDRVLTGERVEQEVKVPYEYLGLERWVHIAYEPERAGDEVIGWVAVVKNITPRKEAEEAVRAHEQQLSLIYANVGDVIFYMSVGTNGLYRFESVNHAFLQTTGLSEAEVVGRYVHNVIPEPSLSLVLKRYREAIDRKQTVAWEETTSYPTGTKVGVVNVTPVFDGNGVCTHLVGTVHDVTERKRAEDMIRRAEERYRAFVSQSTEAIWRFELTDPVDTSLPIDEQIEACYRYAYLAECNDAMARMYGYNHYSEIVGARLGDLMPKENPVNLSYLKAFVQNGYRIDNAESEETDKDGNPVYFVNNLVGVIEEGKVVRAWGTQRDNTERRLAELATQRFNQRFTIAETALDGYVYEWDIVNNRVWRSANFERVLGYAPAEIEATSEGFRKLVHAADADRLERNFENVWRNKPQHYSEEFRVRHKDGRYVWMRDHGFLTWDDNGRAVSMIGSIVNVHEHKLSTQRLEQLVDERTRSLQRSNATLEHLNAELASFAHVASHDLREPIRKTLSFGDYLVRREKEKLTERGADYLVRMHAAAQRMDAMLDDLLTFSRVNTWDTQREAVDLNAVASQAKSTLSARIEIADATVSIGALPTVTGATFQLRQLFIQLIDNAVKFRRPDVRPQIDVTGETIAGTGVAQLDPTRTYLRLSFHDNGIGIEPQYHERVFGLFQRLHSKERYDGTGIGLAICRKIAENHQGVIEVESKPGVGTTFHVYLLANLNA